VVVTVILLDRERGKVGTSLDVQCCIPMTYSEGPQHLLKVDLCRPWAIQQILAKCLQYPRHGPWLCFL
jgi:hypothetical protein